MKTGMNDRAENRKILPQNGASRRRSTRSHKRDGVVELTGRGCPCMIYQWMIAKLSSSSSSTPQVCRRRSETCSGGRKHPTTDSRASYNFFIPASVPHTGYVAFEWKLMRRSVVRDDRTRASNAKEIGSDHVRRIARFNCGEGCDRNPIGFWSR